MLLRPSRPKPSQSYKGFLEDPSLLTQFSWKDYPGGLILEEKGRSTGNFSQFAKLTSQLTPLG